MKRMVYCVSAVALVCGCAADAEPVMPDVFGRNAMVLFQGDSITHGGRMNDMNHYLGHGYQAEIAMRYLAYHPEWDLQFANRGESGHTSSNLVARWGRDAVPFTARAAGEGGVFNWGCAAKTFTPDVLSILVGINDYMRHDGNWHVTAENYERNLHFMVTNSAAANPKMKIVLCEPFRLPEDKSPDFLKRQAIARRVAETYNVAFVPFQKLFSERLMKIRPHARYWFWDAYHPTYAGHMKMADFWLETVAREFASGKGVPKVKRPPNPAEQALAARLDLLNAAALARLADDWDATWGTRAEAAAVRAFAAGLDGRLKASRVALEDLDAAPARALLAEHRRLVAAHPLVKDLKIVSLKHVVGESRARRDEHPATPWLSCYNGLDAAKGNDTKIVALSNLSGETVCERILFDPPGGGSIHAMDLHWDAGRAVFSHVPEGTNAWRLYEADLGTGRGTALLPDSFIHEADDCCYLPDDKVVFTSDAAEQGLPCESGRWRMTNMYRLDPKDKAIMRLTYDQDSDWYPSVLNDGRIQYVRWEYCDISHYFSRIVMTMRPDGTRQMGFYGSNGYWPNHYGNPLAIPGDNGKFVCIATGHHTPKSGKIAIFDANRARSEAAGCVQLVPGWGKAPKDVVMDRLYQDEFPRALYPYPLGATPKDGAGKFFLCAMKPSPTALWGIYLVDVFDNVTLLKEEEGTERTEPIAWLARKRPPVIPDTRRENVGDSTVYVGDVHEGPGLKDVPRGTIRSVRLFAYHYGFNHAASHEGMGVESSWDAKYVLGTVPVDEKGSVFFTAPANTPISLQPLDAEGRAVQLMRSWIVGMPGEHVSCLGCHENANAGSTHVPVVKGAPAKITPMAGLEKPRAWSFLREVQPILNRRCAGCHADDPDPRVKTKKPGLAGCPDADGVWIYHPEEQTPFLTATKPNLTDIRPTALLYGSVKEELKPEFSAAGAFARSYWYLQRYVRRPGPESDNHLFNPCEYHAGTSPLVQLLKVGHHGVRLTDDEWRVLYTWIDLNAPFWGTWTDFVDNWCYGNARNWGMLTWPKNSTRVEQRRRFCTSHDRRRHGEKRYQGWWNPLGDPELDAYGFKAAEADLARVAFVPPAHAEPPCARIPVAPKYAGAGRTMPVALPGGRTMVFHAVADGLAFAETELPLQAYQAFASGHRNGFYDLIGKDHTNGGRALDEPKLPVVRVSFDEAKAYCAWLSQRTGRRFRLPTESEWEQAARAGVTGDNLWNGDLKLCGRRANVADKNLGYPNFNQGFNYHLRDPEVDDGVGFLHDVDHVQEANGYGLRAMIGNVEEWTVGTDGRPVAKGGAFDTIPRWATFSRRVTLYEPWQRVYNVGIRLALEE